MEGHDQPADFQEWDGLEELEDDETMQAEYEEELIKAAEEDALDWYDSIVDEEEVGKW